MNIINYIPVSHSGHLTCYLLRSYVVLVTDNCQATEAGSIINTIRKRFIQQIPGYDEAEWHIN